MKNSVQYDTETYNFINISRRFIVSSLFYYSISSNLTENEIILIDQQVSKNQEAVSFFIRKLPFKARKKVKKFLGYGMCSIQLSQTLAFSIMNGADATTISCS